VGGAWGWEERAEINGSDPQIISFSSLSLAAGLACTQIEERNESRTYGGGGGDESLIRDGGLVFFTWPVAIDTPLVLNEILLTDETRWRVEGFGGS
jgi:hypothetical protein